MSFKTDLNRYATLFHKWLGLVVGIQVLLWMLSGFIMTYYEIEVVRSEHNIAEPDLITFSVDYPLAPVNLVLSQVEGPVKEVKLRSLVDLPVYEVTLMSGEVELYHALAAQKLSPLPEAYALVIADADFIPEATPSEAIWVEEHNLEYRGDVPVWMVNMNDVEGTHLYISPQTGMVVARRSDVWRLFDFFWMLHIMDYENRTDFNNPLVIWASLFAFVFSVTGIVMLFFRFKRRDFGIR